MGTETRYAKVQPSVAPLRQVESTRVATARMLVPRSVEELFRDKQRMMASAVLEEPRSGLFVFAAHLRFGHVARLWLEAGATPRAGLIGRHDSVDLALPLDDALSLRHLMFVVRKESDGVRFAALDLETVNGVQLESGQQARLVEAVGPLIVAASDFVFFCVPTGQPLAWNPDAANPWATLLPRAVSRLEPLEAATGEALVGRVELRSPQGRGNRLVDAASLRRGVLVGRAERCDVVTTTTTVSRVHAVLLHLDDEVFLFDAGSSNGTWRGDDEVKVAALRDEEPFMLGSEVSLRWHAAH